MNASGLEQSTLDNFNFQNVVVNGTNAGEVNYAKGWNFKSVMIKAKDNSTITVKNSGNLKL